MCWISDNTIFKGTFGNDKENVSLDKMLDKAFRISCYQVKQVSHGSGPSVFYLIRGNVELCLPFFRRNIA